MNFNFSQKPEYDLYRKLTHENIQLYGIPCKFIRTTKENKDFIWGEYSHLKIDNDNVFEIHLKLGNDSGWNTQNIYSKFGIMDQDQTDLYISGINLALIHPDLANYSAQGWDEIIGDLIVFPSGKTMEVTHIEEEVDGQSNLFAYTDLKNLYKISAKIYINNSDEITQAVIEDVPSFTNLESIFNVDEERKTQQEETLKDTRVNISNVFGDLG
jgi:hypothetical protein